MNICFVVPPHTDQEVTEETSPHQLPLGILCLAAHLKSDHHVALLDMNVPIASAASSAANDASKRLDHWTTRILSVNPDVVGFSCMCNSFHITTQLAARCKQLAPEVPILFGGPHCTELEADILESFDFVDAVVSGEADNVILPVIEALADAGADDLPSNVYLRGVGRGTAPCLTPGLDALPMPQYDLVAADDYPELAALRHDVEIGLDAGRGCPYTCAFCATRHIWGTVRQKSPERLLGEMARLAERYHKRSFGFIHDSFMTKRHATDELLDRFISEDAHATWSCSIKPDLLDESTIEKFARAGCRGMFFGLETGSVRTQAAIGKRMDIGKCVRNVRCAMDNGIKITTSFVIGFPFESNSDLQETLDLHKRMVDAGVRRSFVNTLSPLPSSRLYREGHELVFDGFPSNISNPIWQLDEESVRLIKSHPKLFSSFYKYVPKELSLMDVTVAQLCANTYAEMHPNS